MSLYPNENLFQYYTLHIINSMASFMDFNNNSLEVAFLNKDCNSIKLGCSLAANDSTDLSLKDITNNQQWEFRHLPNFSSDNFQHKSLDVKKLTHRVIKLKAFRTIQFNNKEFKD